jgi:predicted DNA-binding transcriptional regulator AlpA
MSKRQPSLLTVRDVAERTGAGVSTVTLWCRQGRFPNAEPTDTPRGVVWYIPEGDLEGITVRGRGRPPKSAAAPEKRATGRIRASNGTAPGKQKGRKK